MELKATRVNMQKALYARDLATMQQLAEAKPDLLAPDGNYNLLANCIFGRLDDVAIWLLQYNETIKGIHLFRHDVDCTGIMGQAGARASATVFRALLKAVDRVFTEAGSSATDSLRGIALMNAAAQDNTDVVALLLEEADYKPSDIILNAALKSAAMSKNDASNETIRLLRQAGAQASASDIQRAAERHFKQEDFNIERQRSSTTQGAYSIHYRGELVGTFADDIQITDKTVNGKAQWQGHSDARIMEICRKLYMEGGKPFNDIEPLHLKNPMVTRLIDPIQAAPAKRAGMRA